MKIIHSITGLSKISFTTTKQINPVTGAPTGIEIDNWEDIPHSTAIGLEELQTRMAAVETMVEQVVGEGKLLELIKFIEKREAIPEKPEKEPIPPGKPLSRISKPKRGPKKAKETL
jgi:hypothetical protein